MNSETPIFSTSPKEEFRFTKGEDQFNKIIASPHEENRSGRTFTAGDIKPLSISKSFHYDMPLNKDVVHINIPKSKVKTREWHFNAYEEPKQVVQPLGPYESEYSQAAGQKIFIPLQNNVIEESLPLASSFVERKSGRNTPKTEKKIEKKEEENISVFKEIYQRANKILEKVPSDSKDSKMVFPISMKVQVEDKKEEKPKVIIQN